MYLGSERRLSAFLVHYLLISPPQPFILLSAEEEVLVTENEARGAKDGFDVNDFMAPTKTQNSPLAKAEKAKLLLCRDVWEQGKQFYVDSSTASGLATLSRVFRGLNCPGYCTKTQPCDRHVGYQVHDLTFLQADILQSRRLEKIDISEKAACDTASDSSAVRSAVDDSARTAEEQIEDEREQKR
ncbi:hypothetical protein EJ03DRAFT_339114 [Teratosphaeria nubilosa]|uniref:Uncharacterized protein n=1 Tax=Teratosphaeria nubilosa TaxID=161662 RepID=A0A6G1KYJ0_9PEZI|nr:hypothetical protein EJ03DRAFT_339114 [Teratosphaeria nubilosa]